MSRKLLCLMSFVLVLGMTAVSPAGLDDDPALEGWWKFDGDALDSSPNGRHGTLMGDAHIIDVGLHGQAISFDGSGDYVNIDGYKGINAVDEIQHAFSIANWVRCTFTSGDREMVTWGTSAGRQRLTWRVYASTLRTEHASGNLRGNTVVSDGEWHHVALTVAEGANLREDVTKLYVDGAEDTYQSGSNNTYNLTPNVDVRIGMSGPQNGRYFLGDLDDVRIYSRVLDPNEIAELAIRPKSYQADPAIGAVIEEASYLLNWVAGDVAVEHDVYIGTTPDLGADQLLGRQAAGPLLAVDLQKDTTYYWRVDDVLADGTVNTGDTWSFWIPPRSSYDPSPEDGISLLGTTVTLGWSGGFTPIMHNVNFGTDPAALLPVSMMQMDTTYDPGPLETGTTYYWRIDEFYGIDTVEGPVWSFTTVPVLPTSDDPNLVAEWTFEENSGNIVLDTSGNTNHAVLRNDAQVVAGRDGNVLDLGLDGYGDIANLVYDADNQALPEVTVSVWIRTDSPDDQYILSFDRDENYRLEINGFGGGPGQVGWDVMTLLDGAQTQIDYGSVTRVDDGQWHHVAGVFDNGTATIYIDGFAEPSATGGPVYGTGATDTRYGLIARNSEKTSFESGPSSAAPLLGEMDDLRIYDRAFSEDEMRQLYGNLLMAWQPQPELGADVDVMGTVLSWTAGDGAVEHDVYLGTDPNAVAAADASTSLGRQAETSLALGTLEFGTAYYWRVDEVAADGTVTAGRVWPFSTAAELVIFEEETVVPYDNTVDPFVTAIDLDFDPAMDLTDPIGRVAFNYTGQAAPGSVTVGDVNGVATTTIVGRGDDIWGTADQFQYAYTTLMMNGSMTVKVDSLADTNPWTKAGIMIRETLDPGSAFAGVYFATTSNGVRFQARAMGNTDATSDSSVATDEQKAVTLPVWLKIERMFPMINAYYSTDGVTFVPMSWNPQVIPMSPAAPVHIGLAVTSHSGAATYATAEFSEITSDGGVTPGPLTSMEIGLESNSDDPMYLVLEDASGASAAVMNPDPAAAQQASATDWVVDLAEFNVDLSAAVKATLAIGNLDAPAPGGTGVITINNVRLLGMLPPMDEDFESYAVGTDLHGVNDWEGWQGAAGAGAPVSDAFASSGLNSIEIIGTADLVKKLDIAAGTITLTAMQYIPSGTTGDTFFILMDQYDPNPLKWASQTKFSLASGQIEDGLATIVYDQWVELKYVIDLDANTYEQSYDGVVIRSEQWSGDGNNTLQAIDLYSAGASSVYYDDILIED